MAGLGPPSRSSQLGRRLTVLTIGGTALPVSRILCLGAHSDDIEIGCGGTLLKLLDDRPGVAVDWVVLSATGQRRNEAQAGADGFLRKAGERSISLLDFRERYFPFEGAAIKSYFDDLGANRSPDLVLSPSLSDAHQDHRTVAEIAAATFRDHLILQYEIPKYDGDLGQPSVYVRLTSEQAGRKVDLLMETFATQHARPWFTEETFRSLMRIRGIEAKAPDGYAEAFHCRRLVVS